MNQDIQQFLINTSKTLTECGSGLLSLDELVNMIEDSLENKEVSREFRMYLDRVKNAITDIKISADVFANDSSFQAIQTTAQSSSSIKETEEPKRTPDRITWGPKSTFTKF